MKNCAVSFVERVGKEFAKNFPVALIFLKKVNRSVKSKTCLAISVLYYLERDWYLLSPIV